MYITTFNYFPQLVTILYNSINDDKQRKVIVSGQDNQFSLRKPCRNSFIQSGIQADI